MMRSTQVLCVCHLFISSYAIQCEGQESCAAEKDVAALLQGAVQVRAMEAGCSGNLDQASCEAGECTNVAGSCCTWYGSKCNTACSEYSEGKGGAGKKLKDCPEYCFNSRKYGCTDFIPVLAVGGLKAGQSGSGRGAKLKRPEYKVTERLVAQTGVLTADGGPWPEDPVPYEWEACGGTVNCWARHEGHLPDLRIDLTDSKYAIASIEFPIACKHAGELEFRTRNGFKWVNGERHWRKPRNAQINVWYNLQPVDSTTSGGHRKTITINSADKDPILRVEVSRINKAQDATAQIMILLNEVRTTFDTCMEGKHNHGQCLQAFDEGLDKPLRSSRALQAQCLDPHDSTLGDSIDGCPEWRDCLSDESKGVIYKVSKATTLVHAVSSTPSTPAANCASHRTCVDPITFDVEAYDCDCFDWLIGKTPEEINAIGCSRADTCCAWKEKHCTAPSAMLLERVESAKTDRKKEGTLDETMDDKCM